jgi:hypothetical protein
MLCGRLQTLEQIVWGWAIVMGEIKVATGKARSLLARSLLDAAGGSVCRALNAVGSHGRDEL